MRRLLAPLVLAGLLAACGGGTDSEGVPVADPAPGFGEQISAVSCDAGGHDAAYHIHSILSVVLPDGSSYTIPEDIGISERCMYWVHTHETDSLTAQIHVEAPTETTATLADFLEIWRRTTNPTIPNAVAAGLAEIRVVGEPVADAASVILEDGLGIQIILSAYPER